MIPQMPFLRADFEGDALTELKMDAGSWFSLFLPPQERLSYIGPEEFVQAFVQKDPLDNDKVTSACFAKNNSPDKRSIHSSYAIFLWAVILRADLVRLRLGEVV